MTVDGSVLAPFDRIVAATPDALAVIDADGTPLTYRQLRQAADHFAARLPIEPGEMVGLSMPRCANLVAAMVGIVRASGVYVPFSGDEPPQRRAALQARLGLRYWVDGEVSCLRDGEPPILDATAFGTGDDLPLYAMWTSGSTGDPKAVVVPHRGVLRLADDRTLTDFVGGDRMAFASNPAFDAATWEVWAALANGATIVVISHDDLLDARRLRTRLDACGVTLAFLTTALFDHLARHDPDMFGGLRTLAVGGEQMRPAGVRAVLQSATPPQRLVNVYGPTEATTFSCSRPVTHLAIDAVRVPIGHPLLQTELAVVDEHGARVPAGSTGELWIAGSGLACGYLGDAEATNHAFVDASLPGLLGSRWYRTGDLAVQRANGEFECLGRIDRQLKVNGHRIEPAEVERAIQTIDGVNAAAVVAQPKGTSTRLLGFVVADGSITASDISAGLAATLHAFMRPSRVLLVDSLPITANGKLDEAALLGRLDDDPSVPSSPGALVEDPLADFIAEQARLILQQPGIRPTDDLFAVGLDSLAAAELCGRIADAGLPSPAPTLLIHHRTALQLADRIRSGWRQSNSTVVRVGQPHLPPMFFVPGGGSTALFINDVASFLGDRLRVVTVEPRGLHTDERRDHSVRRMASRVTEAIRAEGVTGPVALCGHSSGGVIAYEAAQQLVAQGHTVRLLLLDSRFLGNDGPPLLRWLGVWGNAVLRRARRLRHFIGGGAAETPATTQPTTRLTRYYERSMTVAWRATRRYRARRTSAELRCLHVAGFCGACALSIPGNRGTCLQIGGEHRTLARPQHLAAWAPEAADWLLGEA